MPGIYHHACCCGPAGVACQTIAFGQRAHATPFTTWAADVSGTITHFTGNLRCYYEGSGFGQPYEGYQAKAAAFAGGKACHRLFVWTGLRITGNAVDAGDAARTPDYILRTGTVGSTTAGNVFGDMTPRPYYTSVDPVTGVSGIRLDDEPYWWADCLIGGWDDVTATHWYKPRLDYVDALRVPALADGVYNYFVIAVHRSLVTNDAHGSTVLIPVTDGSVAVELWKAIRTGD